MLGAVSEPLDHARLDRIRQQLTAMITVTESTIGAVRRIAADLRPSVYVVENKLVD